MPFLHYNHFRMTYPEISTLDGQLTLPGIKTDSNNQVEIDFLFPNGILIPLKVNYFSPLDQIKQIIWREVHNYPLANNLLQEDAYSFTFINTVGEKEEVLDESQNLEQLQPFMGLFQLVKKKGDTKTKTLDKKISNLIGQGLSKQESFQAAEIFAFKQRMTDLCKEIATQRRSQTAIEKFTWRYPLRLRKDPALPDELQASIIKGCIVLDIGFAEEGVCYKLQVDHLSNPDAAIKRALSKKSNGSGSPVDDSELFILKVIGQEEYLYGDYPLIQFKYVYQCLVKKTAPQFWMVRKAALLESNPPVPRRQTLGPMHSPIADVASFCRSPDSNVSVWKSESLYAIQIKGISKIQLADGSKIKIYVGIYHGAESLCDEKETEDLTIQDSTCSAKIDITFDIRVADLPHCARLCFALYTFGGNTKRKDLAAWVNIPVYDFKQRLQRGDRELPMWPQDLLQQPDEHCYPLGGVALNTLCLDATFLRINFPDVDHSGSAYLIYPSYDMVLECASQNMEPEGAPGSPNMKVSKSHIEQLTQALYQADQFSNMKVSKSHIEQLTQALYQADQLFEQDKELIWILRYEVRQRFPNSLSKVLQSVRWNNYVDVAKMTALLQTWPNLPVDYALEILDYEYPDHNVREFAVRCLDEELGDDDFSQYMLQLVQALKFETHLICPLAELLLTRALKNQHLGHKLFWLLRSELHNPAVTTQYSLILKIYLKNNHDHLCVLMKQQDALKKLSALNSLIKEGKIGDEAKREEAKVLMMKVLEQPTYKKFFSDLYSPLSPLYKMQELKVEKCTFMNSKKRPLWLVWSNADNIGPDIQIIYKNGDDLRQDMLTLQILQVMDNIWQAEGLDFRMNPYMCMATDREQGMIEVVTPAETMANIQKWYKSAFDKRALFEWLKAKHPDEKSLNAAVEEFLMSCAGYCVATYVLGIGDRHNDNIMMKTSGQMFHIDFGHFLGNFKSKFHVKRERVPFVLTTHFVHLITKGNAAPDNFKRFRTMCEKAYLILRQKFSLLMSLFMMMLSGGIPQLTSPKDVNYLRETLVPHLSEADARAHFRHNFDEALQGSWKTSLNFWFHMKAK
ncbi:phosphatidylinositol 4,5-bisphosphate 3-kinase catalytic subunit delta isoform-like [Physella acuta]|uniref:phosphatidylinositol 4,5-bisphosphate 3-kinase catalytic subunit delta isoform-like n=1 Tax=Physella acuta TaxID=109671 RepID=UPI0027DB66A1|nr:phosphatidylinositol 4,5-bisphosphate 3-kinase catalytic subunit delta isoform-like [Physella acuta]